MLLVLAGAFDPPGHATPLSDAEKPALDRMARAGRAGNVALSGRSPWEGFTELLGLGTVGPSLGAAEALGAGLDPGPGECVYRADFVTLADGVVRDPFGGRIKDPEAAALLDAVRAAVPGLRIVRAGGHRNLVFLPGEAQFCPSPWEMAGRKPASGLPPEGPVRDLHLAAAAALAAHDVNTIRVDLGENPANALWIHGGGAAAVRGAGAAPAGGAVLVGRGAAVKGLAQVLGWQDSIVEGDDEVLAAAALAALGTAGLVVVRTESVLDATSLGGAEARRDALSRVDARLVAPLLAAAEERDAFVMVVAADCVVDAATHALVRRPVPCVVAGAGRGVGDAAFTERACDVGGYRLASGAELFALLR